MTPWQEDLAARVAPILATIPPPSPLHRTLLANLVDLGNPFRIAGHAVPGATLRVYGDNVARLERLRASDIIGTPTSTGGAQPPAFLLRADNRNYTYPVGAGIAQPDVGTEIIWVAGVLQERVVSPTVPGTDQYTLVPSGFGAIATFGMDIDPSWSVRSLFFSAAAPAPVGVMPFPPELLTRIDTRHYSLSTVPQVDTEIIEVSTVLQERVPSLPGDDQYTLSGAILTFGMDIDPTYRVRAITYWA